MSSDWELVSAALGEFDDDEGVVTEPIRLWASIHANGWEAWVARHDDGTYTAWACPAGGDAVAIYIEDGYEHATAAALFDLRRLSNHDVCGAECSGWDERELPRTQERSGN